MISLLLNEMCLLFERSIIIRAVQFLSSIYILVSITFTITFNGPKLGRIHIVDININDTTILVICLPNNVNNSSTARVPIVSSSPITFPA